MFSLFKRTTELIVKGCDKNVYVNLHIRNSHYSENDNGVKNLNKWMWRTKPNMDGVKCQNIDYLLVMDFEATCGTKGNKPNPQEIIEFPCALLNVKHGFQVEAIFHKYVRPVRHPLLSTFCTDLTGITQVMC